MSNERLLQDDKQFIFIIMWQSSGLQTSVAFLTKHVIETDKDDWGKLQRMVKYLNGIKSPSHSHCK